MRDRRLTVLNPERNQDSNGLIRSARTLYGVSMSDLPSYLRDLRTMERPFPKASMETAIERREEATPYLLESLERAAEALEAGNAEEVDELPIYALFLLAQFRDTRAFDLIRRLARHPDVDDLLGDVTTDGLDRMLASTCGSGRKYKKRCGR